MKPKTLILMGLAVTCGLGASYMTSQLLAERQPPEVEKVEILVAKRNLNVAEPIKKPEDLFEKKLVAVDQEPKDAIKDFDVLKNKIMKQHLRKGDHVTLSELYGDTDVLPIPEGHKAVGLRVTLDTTVAGFATLPHSRVNIIQTVRRQNEKDTYVQVLLEDVLVLAADTQVDRNQGIAAPASVVTFALKDEDVLRVTLAKHLGELSLSLRKPNDPSRSPVQSMTASEIGPKRKREAQAEAPPPEPSPPAPVKVAEEPKVVDEGPKGTQHVLNIINGTQQHSTRFLRTEDGQNLEQDSQVTGSPNRGRTPAAPAAPKSKSSDL